jgi:tetratricopeptide (TPR) repeat protein
MARCWTCGSYLSGGITYLTSCPLCAQVRETQLLRKDGINSLNKLSEAQQQGFQSLKNSIDNIAGIVEWGFEEVSWQIQQQTEVLRSIDHTLKTPTQTQANEWRIMADELRRRRVFDKAEQLYIKAVNSNPLDYRTYIGIAYNYLDIGQPSKARLYLEDSIPHAPKGSYDTNYELGNDDSEDDFSEPPKSREEIEKRLIKLGKKFRSSKGVFENDKIAKLDLDYKSFSYRLIGRTYFCEEDYVKAAEALNKSIKLSPTYYAGHYDYAQYNSLLQAHIECINSLRIAVTNQHSFYSLAQKEVNFEPVRPYVQGLLQELWEEPFSKANSVIKQAQHSLDEVRQVMNIIDNEHYNNARTFLHSAKEKFINNDYYDLFEIPVLANESIKNAKMAMQDIKAESEKNAQRKKEANKTLLNYSLIGALIGTTVGYLGSCVINTIYSNPVSNTPIIVLGIIGLLIGFVIAIIQNRDYFLNK